MPRDQVQDFPGNPHDRIYEPYAHELEILRREVARPKLGAADRALLAAFASYLPRSSFGVLSVTPRTLFRWHRALVCRMRKLETPAPQVDFDPGSS